MSETGGYWKGAGEGDDNIVKPPKPATVPCIHCRLALSVEAMVENPKTVAVCSCPKTKTALLRVRSQPHELDTDRNAIRRTGGEMRVNG